MSDTLQRPSVPMLALAGRMPRSSARRPESASQLFGATALVDSPDATVFLRGELDLSTVKLLRACLETLPADVGDLILDFAQLDFIDCAGLSAILAWARQQAGHGGTLNIRSPQPMARRVLELTELARFASTSDTHSNGLVADHT